METESIHPAVDALALAMMNSFGQLSIILMHMHRHQAEGRSGPDAPAPPFMLTEMLKGILGALADEHSMEDVATAAQMLVSATQIIGDELFLIDMDKFSEIDVD